VQQGQTMHNFTVTDSDGRIHKLYEDYLNNGKTVVIKFFFTTCPPCVAIAPQWQQKYVSWGSGNHDVQFLEPTILASDTNIKVKSYKTNLGLTMPGIGHDGSATSIVDPFKSGTYGGWYGTPSFAVIAPDKTIQFPVQFSALDAAIAATGAEMPTMVAQPTTVTVTSNSGGFNVGSGHIKFFLKPRNADTPKLEIMANNQGQLKFEYPSVAYPAMFDPIVVMESFASDYLAGISTLDLALIQRHILALNPFTKETERVAADINGDDRITAQDIVFLRKLILGIIAEFPNNRPSYVSLPASRDVTSSPGQTVNLTFDVVKIGNVN
jgi:thiol-disulfide isomerase/thioredoxin